jgi:hypothetical protein
MLSLCQHFAIKERWKAVYSFHRFRTDESSRVFDFERLGFGLGMHSQHPVPYADYG